MPFTDHNRDKAKAFVNDTLELSVRAAAALVKLQVTDLDTFLRLEKEDVMRVPNAGIRTWNEIHEVQLSFQISAAERAFDRLRQLADMWNYQLALVNEDERKARNYLFTMDSAGYVSCWERKS